MRERTARLHAHHGRRGAEPAIAEAGGSRRHSSSHTDGLHSRHAWRERRWDPHGPHHSWQNASWRWLVKPCRSPISLALQLFKDNVMLRSKDGKSNDPQMAAQSSHLLYLSQLCKALAMADFYMCAVRVADSAHSHTDRQLMTYTRVPVVRQPLEIRIYQKWAAPDFLSRRLLSLGGESDLDLDLCRRDFLQGPIRRDERCKMEHVECNKDRHSTSAEVLCHLGVISNLPSNLRQTMSI